jgi:hypothetical protein
MRAAPGRQQLARTYRRRNRFEPGRKSDELGTFGPAGGGGPNRRARLIVMGSHSHNRLTGAALGSTGKRLLHLAETPVLICRSDGDC